MSQSSRKSLILPAIALLALVVAPLSVWAAGGLQIDACVPVGDTVMVKVANPAPNAQSGLLSITAVVNGSPMTSMSSITVDGGSARYAVVSFGGHVDGVLTTKIVEDGSPM